jgi:hypothetical protein
MIIRPLDPPAQRASEEEFIPAWRAVERLQRTPCESCWMITQPSHAALAGDIAAALSDYPHVPKLEADLIRAIALHDAGWGIPDAQAVMRSRAVQQNAPKSFLEVPVPEFLVAWTQSIDVALSTSPAGGYMVSRHFWRLAEHRINTAEDAQLDRKRLQDFLDSEAERQKKLSTKQGRSVDELEALADVLQFCDLISLYLCSGAQAKVEFPEYFGNRLKLTPASDGFRLDPPLIPAGTQFSVAALRHPAIKGESGRQISFQAS